MPFIDFPDVPDVAGVPTIPRSLDDPTPNGDLDFSQGEFPEDQLGAVEWGVFDESGNPVLQPDTFLDMEYRQDMRISNYPQEEGAFASYNKVGTPYDCRMRMAIGADRAARTSFLATVDGMLNSLDLFSVVSPEVSYPSACLVNYTYRRTATDGVSMLTVDLMFTQVRVTATAEFSPVNEPQEPSAAEPESSGQVQATPVTQSTVTAVDLPPLGTTGTW